jgi:hypothetical protein
MIKPRLIIRKTDLLDKPCDRYADLPNEFDVVAEIEKRGNRYDDVSWLIKHCKIAQTQEMFEYYKGLNPDYENVSWLIATCKFAQTSETLEYYMGLNPDYEDVNWLIRHCEFAQTVEMLEYYRSLTPDDKDVSWLIETCDFVRENYNKINI